MSLRKQLSVIPANARIQSLQTFWTPASAGVTVVANTVSLNLTVLGLCYVSRHLRRKGKGPFPRGSLSKI
jgi:hypothetical protein